MKKAYVGSFAIVALIASTTFVGTTLNKDTTKVGFNSYYFNNISDDSIGEFIEVEIDSNEISKGTIKEINNLIGNKNIETILTINNLQGVQIAKLDETKSKEKISIDKNYQTHKANVVELENQKDFKESVNIQRQIVKEGIIDDSNLMIKKFDKIGQNMSDKVIYDKERLIELAKSLSEQRSLENFRYDSFMKDTTDFQEDKKVKDATDCLRETSNQLIDLINASKQYELTKKEKDLKNFKSKILEYKATIARYKAQVNSLD